MKKWNSTYALLGIVAMLCLIPRLAQAQQNRADVTGIVKSEITGEALWGVSVTVNNAANNFSASVQTDSAGVFTSAAYRRGLGTPLLFPI